MKPEYNLDCWSVVGMPEDQRLIGIFNRYDNKDSYRNTVRTSKILGRRGNAIETKNSIYNLLECSIPESKEDMLKYIKELENA